jgi:hypothetical protein
MGPKKDDDSSKVKRKNTNIMIDVKKETIAEHENCVLVSDLGTQFRVAKSEERKRIRFQTITFHFLTTFHLRRQLSSIQVQ